jgi:hypothetical protein
VAGPHTNEEALIWVQFCLREGRYVPAVHFQERLAQREFIMADVRSAIENPTEIRPYESGSAVNGGTCWRITGKNIDGDRDVAVGIEAFEHKHKRRVCLCTVIDVTKEGA